MARMEVHNAVVTRIIDFGLGLTDQSSLKGGVYFEAPTLFDGEYPEPAKPQFQFASKDGAGWFFVPEVGDEIEVEIYVDDGTEDVTDVQLPEPRIRCMLYNSVNDLAPEFKENYGKRMGFKSRGGHVFMFDDTAGSSFVHILTKGGTMVKVDDTADEVTLKANFGDTLRVSRADGVQVTTPAAGGTSLSMKAGKVDLQSALDMTITATTGKLTVKAGQDVEVQSDAGKVAVKGATEVSALDATNAGFKVAAGKVAVGNTVGEIFALLEEVVTALSTCTAPGFGAPISLVGQMPAILTKIAAVKGSL